MNGKWIDVSKYCSDRKRTRNAKFARYVRAQYRAKERAEFMEKVIFT